MKVCAGGYYRYVFLSMLLVGGDPSVLLQTLNGHLYRQDAIYLLTMFIRYLHTKVRLAIG